MENRAGLYQYSQTMSQISLPRWQDLPDISLYCDQLLQFVKDKLSFIFDYEKPVTKSMVNNYVKWGMMPKPVQKKYQKEHIAHMIVIALLKHILPISTIKDGIFIQVSAQGNKGAYDAFCEAFEDSMRQVFLPALDDSYIRKERAIDNDSLAMVAITTALANKLLTEKIIDAERQKHAKPKKKKEKAMRKNKEEESHE